MARFKDVDWGVCAAEHDQNQARTWNDVKLAVLMDLRDELKESRDLLRRLVSTFECPNAQAIPTILRSIRRNTAKPRKRRKVTAR